MAKALPETILSAQSGARSIGSLTRWFNCLFFVGCAVIVGCTSTNTTSNQAQIREDLATEDVRTTGNTAPLELQLACASAAPANLGLSTDNVLPISTANMHRNTMILNDYLISPEYC